MTVLLKMEVSPSVPTPLDRGTESILRFSIVLPHRFDPLLELMSSGKNL